MTYTIKYNRTSYHIDGIHEATKSTGEAKDGAVAYYAQSACSGLSRSGNRMAVGPSNEDLAEAVKTAQSLAANRNMKFCANCAKAAARQIEQEQATEEAAQQEEDEASRAEVETPAQRVNRAQIEAHESATLALSDRPQDMAAIDAAIDAGARWMGSETGAYTLHERHTLKALAKVGADFTADLRTEIDQYRR